MLFRSKPPGPSWSSEPLGDEDEEVAVGLEGVEFPGGELEVDEHSGGLDVLGEVVEVVAATGTETGHEATTVFERSEERRVGKEGRCRWGPTREEEKEKMRDDRRYPEHIKMKHL